MSDEWYLPKSKFKEICQIANLTPKLDIAATDKYHLTEYYYTKEDNALTREWLIKDGTKKTGVYANPPLSLCKYFVLKACQQWCKHNINIMMIIPIGVCARKYFKGIWKLFIRKHFVEVIPISRPTFLEEGKKAEFSARNDYMLLIFRKR